MKSRRRRKSRINFITVIITCLQILVICLMAFSVLTNDIKISNSDKQQEQPQDRVERSGMIPAKEASSDLAHVIDGVLVSHNYQGVALLVQNGAPVLHKAYGYANLNTKKPNTINSLFPIGSIQKNLTALLIMQAVEDKKLSLSTKLNSILPNLKDSEKYSIADLLSMTTGYQSDTKNLNVANLSEDDYLEFVLKHLNVVHYPGTWTYQPANYSILALVLRKIYNKDYKLLLKDYIERNKINLSFFSQFDLSADTTFSQKSTGQMNPHVPVEYTREVGTGEVSMTASALYQLLEKEFQQTLMSSENLNAMLTVLGDKNYVSGLYYFKDYIHMHGVISDFEVSVYMTKDTQNAIVLSSNKYDPQLMDDLRNKGLIGHVLHISGEVDG